MLNMSPDVEYDCSSLEIFNCYLNKMVTGGCPLPCEIEEYQGHKIYHDLERIGPIPECERM